MSAVCAVLEVTVCAQRSFWNQWARRSRLYRASCRSMSQQRPEPDHLQQRRNHATLRGSPRKSGEVCTLKTQLLLGEQTRRGERRRASVVGGKTRRWPRSSPPRLTCVVSAVL